MTDALFHSLIDVDLWNEAKWTATAFADPPGGKGLPAIGLMFKNSDVGCKIFSDLIARIGKVDESELLRLSIVEGDIPGKEPGYTVTIGTDQDHYIKQATKKGILTEKTLLMTVSRFLRMNPAPGSPFLANFKRYYALERAYLIMPFVGDPNNVHSVQPRPDLMILKKEIHFRNVSEIKENDVDVSIFK